MSERLARTLDADFAALDAAQRLARLGDAVPGRLVFTTSLGLEDQVLNHFIATAGIDTDFATLDTGRLFPETYALWAETEARYGIKIKPYYPRHDALEEMIAAQGINGFYVSIDSRKACCNVRKVEPLSRALAGASGWIAGLRADQSQNRGEASFVAFDAARGLIKANPLLDWTREQAAAFATDEQISVNPLHGRGFLSIGCAPCTRAVREGEPERAGRWWWEDETKKECGLHVTPDGRVVRDASALTEAAA